MEHGKGKFWLKHLFMQQRHSYLRFSDLRGANLIAANLSAADVRDADLRDANLKCANLHQTDIRGSVYNSTTQWPEGFSPKSAGAIYKADTA